MIRFCFLFLSILCLFSVPAFSQTGEDAGSAFNEDEYIPAGEDEKGLTITADFETSGQVIHIDRAAIEESHAADIPQLLEETAGLGITRYGPRGNLADINMRGFDTERVAVLVNGVPVNSPLFGDFDFNTIDLASVERIEVIYGGSDTTYNVSGALGGVINIITVKDFTGWYFGTELSNLSYLPGNHVYSNGKSGDPQWIDLLDGQSLGIRGGYGNKNWSLTGSFSLNRSGNHFLFDAPDGGRRRKTANEFSGSGGNAAFVVKLPEDAKCTVQADFFYTKREVPKTALSGLADIQDDIASRQSIMFDIPFVGKDFSTEISASHQMNLQTVDTTGGRTEKSRVNAVSAINRWNWYLLKQLTLGAGGDYRFVTLDAKAAGERQRHEGGLYLSADWKALETIRFVSSVKAISAGNTAVPVPKLGMVWQPADFFTLKNNYFRSFKFPDLAALHYTMGMYQGDPDLKNEDGWGTDLSGIIDYKKFHLETTAYFQWTLDSIHWYNSTGKWKPENVGEAQIFGLDVAGKTELPVKWGFISTLGFSASYNFQLSYMLSYGYTHASDKRIPYMPMHRAGGSITLGWKGGFMKFLGRFEGTRYAKVDNTLPLDPFVLLDIGLEQKAGSRITFFAHARNILNRNYVTMLDSMNGNKYPMPGFSLTLGMRFYVEEKGSQEE